MAKEEKARIAAEMKAAEEAAEAFRKKLAAERAEQKRRHEEALKAQAKMLAEAAAAQAKADKEATNARHEQAEAQKVYLAQQMAERRAQFTDLYPHTWHQGETGLAYFELTVDFDLGTAHQLIKELFHRRIVADMEEVRSGLNTQTTFKVIFTQNGTMETHEEVYRYVGVTSEDRVAEFTSLVNHIGKNHTRMGRFPAFDLVTLPIASGSKQYIEYAQIETLREKPDAKQYAMLQSDECVDKKYEAQVILRSGLDLGRSY